MPQRKPVKPVPSLLECSALEACRLVTHAVRSDARVPKLERNDDDLSARAVARIDQKCAAIAQCLKSIVPLGLLSDLANEHLPKLCSPTEVSACDDPTFEALFAMCAFLKCGLREVSFKKIIATRSGLPCSSDKYSFETMWSLLFGIMTSPDLYRNLKRLDLKRLTLREEKDVDQLVKAIAQHGKELLHLDLGSAKVTNSTFRHFVPCSNTEGAFTGPVPCPKLTNLKFWDEANLVYASTIVDFLLSHPMLSSFEYKMLGVALNALELRVSQMSDVFGTWKSGLTKAHIVMDDPDDHEDFHDDLSLSALASVSRLVTLLPKVTVLMASLVDSKLLELSPLMQQLEQLVLTEEEDFEEEEDVPLKENAMTLLTCSGRNLTTLGISCISISQLVAINQGCPNLSRLSLDFVYLTGSAAYDLIDSGLFKNVECAELTIGSGAHDLDIDDYDWSLSTALPIFLKDKPLLEKLTLLLCCNEVVTDEFISDWVRCDWTPNLRKVNISRREAFIPTPGIFQLTDAALQKLITLPKISEIGELLFWSVEKSTVDTRRKAVEAAGFDLELVWHSDHPKR